MKRLMIAGTSSGSGKTTVTCAVLAALKARGITATTFKCGPDYIDPMFHRAVTGINACNLDPFFLNSDALRLHLSERSGEISIIEGAMGFYDGIADSLEASSYTVARETKTPVILVVNAKGAGHSLAALIEGFCRYRKDSHIKGVIFNNAHEHRYTDLKRIANGVGIEMYGILPYSEDWKFQSRHLGLLTTHEINNLQEKLFKLKSQAEKSLDIDGLIKLSEAEEISYEKRISKTISANVRLAVAKDNVFCFLYEENLELFRELGCEIVFFSPLKNSALPPNINGLYLCGGYPEIYAEKLSKNGTMTESIKIAIQNGLPTIAECGGFMYLHEKLSDYPMCAVIKGKAFETKKLQRFGYITITANRDNLLCRKGESLRTREFHYWESESPGKDFIAKKAGRDISYSCIHATDTLYAGFPHLYLLSNPAFAENFVERMKQYGAL